MICLREFVRELVLSQMIFIEKLFTLHELNERLSGFSYGYNDKAAIPSAVLMDGAEIKIRQNASQTWCLMRVLPLIIGHLVPPNNQFWGLFLDLSDLLEVVFAPVVYESTARHLSLSVENFLRHWKLVFPQESLTPKAHFLVHYPTALRKYGPLALQTCLPFEALALAKPLTRALALHLIYAAKV